jgi:glycosyltransferase involved in cell wall biosynthesis
VILELHDLVRPGIGRHVLKTAIRLSAGAMAISQSVALSAGQGTSSVGGRFRIVPQAVDTTRFHPGARDDATRAMLSGDPEKLLVGIVGRIDPAKGVEFVVRAVASLAGTAGECRLVVIGAPGLDTGSYAEDVRAEADALLAERVRFTGPLQDVPAALRSLDVLVNASEEEPFGLSVLEAQASGVAVIGTAAGGIPEFVTDGETGLLVPPGDVRSLSAALRRLLEDDDLRGRLARSGRLHAESHHTLDTRADAVAGMYRSMLTGR